MKVRLRQQGFDLQRDYTKCNWPRKDLVVEGGKAVGLIITFAWFFYRSIWAVFPMSILGVLFFIKRQKEKVIENKKQLVLQFQECILSVAASLRVGYSIEKAFLESTSDMKMLFGEKAFICNELELIRRGLVINITLEKLLWDFGQRSGTSEIMEFVEAFAIAKRSGGSIPDLIQTLAELIYHKAKAEEEIITQTFTRRLEQKVMNIMPFAILLYVEFGSPGYFNVLYHNLFGVCLMSGCLAAYLSAYYLAAKILEGACGMW